MKLIYKISFAIALSLFYFTSLSYGSVQSIDFFKFESFKETIQLNIIEKNSLPDINSTNLDFVRASEKQLDIIRKQI